METGKGKQFGMVEQHEYNQRGVEEQLLRKEPHGAGMAGGEFVLGTVIGGGI